MGSSGDDDFRVVVAAAARGARREPVPRRRILGASIAVAALVVIAVAVSGVVAARHLAESEAIADARSTTGLFASALVEPALSDSLEAGDAGQASSARIALDEVVRRSILGVDGVVRVKVWTIDGLIVYSDENLLIGRTYPLEADDREALERGTTDADVTDLRAPENRYERGNGKLLEAYRGVTTPNGTHLLLEVYFRYDHVVQRSGQLSAGFIGIALGSVGALLVLLLPLVAWLLSRLAREESARRELLQRALDASSDERRRIAGTLHDGVVQDLSGAALALSGAAQQLSRTDPVRSRLLAVSARTVRDGIRGLRTLLVDIYPPSLGADGLAKALDDLAATAAARGLPVTVDVPTPSGLDPAGERLVFRVAHECLGNASAHSRATRASVRLVGTRLEIADDGVGFDVDAVLRVPAPGHFGVRVLLDTADEAGAELAVRTGSGRGTTWRLTLPPSPTRSGAPA